jgi:VanZ family protein
VQRIFPSNTIRRNVTGFLPAIVWAVLVTCLSLISPGEVPKVRWLDISGIDKLGHAFFYCVLALWMIYGFFQLTRRYRRLDVLVLVPCIAFGMALEVLQGLMRSGRQYEWWDIAANVAGVLFAYCIFIIFLKKKYYGSK